MALIVRIADAGDVGALAIYRRAGFGVPDEQAGDHRLLVRPRP